MLHRASENCVAAAAVADERHIVIIEIVCEDALACALCALH